MKFTEEHEWLEPDGDTVKVGITEYAAEQLGDIVFIEPVSYTHLTLPTILRV